MPGLSLERQQLGGFTLRSLGTCTYCIGHGMGRRYGPPLACACVRMRAHVCTNGMFPISVTPLFHLYW